MHNLFSTGRRRKQNPMQATCSLFWLYGKLLQIFISVLLQTNIVFSNNVQIFPLRLLCCMLFYTPWWT